MPDPSFKSIPRSTHASKAKVESGTATLPPPGHARDEVLKQRTDTLAEQAETQTSPLHAMNPAALEPDNEILQVFDGTNVTNRQPGYVYCWVNYDSPSSARGLMVKHKLAQQDMRGVRYGWEVVQGEMPESKENKDAAGYRRIGDTILMRIKQENYDRMIADEQRTHMARLSGSHATLQELGDKYRGKGIVVHTGEDMDPKLLKTMESRTRGTMAAEQKLDQALRDGSM